MGWLRHGRIGWDIGSSVSSRYLACMKGRSKGRSESRAQDRPSQASPAWQVLAVVALTVLLLGGVYGQVAQHEFVDYDDFSYFINDPRLDGELRVDDFISAFAEPYVANWSPITSISIRLGDALHGPDPGSHLLTNLFFHGLASVLLFAALLTMTQRVGASAFVGLVFAVHPLHVESVAWASERKDVLAAAFWMAALLMYGLQAARASRWRYGALLAFSTLAMLSKPTAVSLPITLLLLDYWPLGTISDRSSLIRKVIEKWPLVIIAGFVAIMTFVVQDAAGARQTAWLSFWTRCLNAGLSYWTYLLDSLWPANLAVFYPYPDSSRLESWQPLAAWASLALATFLSLRWGLRRPYLLVGWWWFMLTLIPMIGFVQVGTQGHADRYMYVPMVGLLLATAWGISDLVRSHPRVQWVSPVLATMVVTALAFVAHGQVGHWKNTIALFDHALEATGPNPVAHRVLGVAHWEQSRPSLAEEHLRMAVELDPGWSDARLALALCLNHLGRFEEARLHFIQARADGADLGRVHGGLGLAAQQLGEEAVAAREYRAALALRPEEWEVANNLAWLLATARDAGVRDLPEALGFAQRAVAGVPGNSDFLETLARVYAESARYREAAESQERALDALPGDAEERRRRQLRDDLRDYLEQAPIQGVR